MQMHFCAAKDFVARTITLYRRPCFVAQRATRKQGLEAVKFMARFVTTADCSEKQVRGLIVYLSLAFRGRPVFHSTARTRIPRCGPCVSQSMRECAASAAKTGTGTPSARCQSLYFAQVATGCALLWPAGCGFGPGESECIRVCKSGCGNTGQCVLVRNASWPASRQCECAHESNCAEAF